MTWKTIFIFMASLSFATQLLLNLELYFQNRNLKGKNQTLENQAKIAWKKYEMKANEVENLKSRINQTINKPYIH